MRLRTESSLSVAEESVGNYRRVAEVDEVAAQLKELATERDLVVVRVLAER